MSLSLVKSKRIRSGHKAHVRRVINEANELAGNYDRENPEHRSRIKHYKSTLAKKMEVIAGFNEQILTQVEEENIEAEIAESSEFMDEIDICLTTLEDVSREETDLVSNVVAPPTQGNSSQSIDEPAHGSGGSKVRLPKLQLPSFDGNFKDWSAFWDSFDSAINSNQSLTPVEKFSYLRASLRGSAAATIHGLSLSSANYDAAVTLLKERYGDPQKIINAHMDALVNLPIVENSRDLKAVRHLYDEVEANVRALGALGRKAEEYGGLLLPLMFHKIPEEIRLSICNKVSKENWDLEAVLKELKEELANRERCDYSTVTQSGDTSTKEDQKLPLVKKSGGKGPPSTFALMAGSDGNQKPACVYCGQHHSSVQCNIVTNAQKRKEILKNSGRCFICIRKNHLSRNCRSRSRCSKCHGRHHSSICDPTETTRGPASTENQKRENAVDEKRVTSSVNMCVGTRNTVLLQTAKAAIYNPGSSHQKMTIGVILDGGSQRSYVTERVRDALHLPVSHSESLTIKPFGSNTGSHQQCKVVNLCMETLGDNDVTLSAICVPVISSPVQGQCPRQAVRNYPHLTGLTLADDCEGEADIDILVGADQYWNLVTGGLIRGDSGPTAMHTKLGWVLSGPVNYQVPSSSATVNLTSTHVLKCQVSNHPDPDLLESKLERFWRLESLGIVPNESSVYDHFQQRIRYDGKRYEVNLPWKEPHPMLPDNYNLSKSRLVSLLSRLKSDPDVLKEYHAVIQEQLDAGIVERVEEGGAGDVGEVHYLAHHPVVRQDKQTTKVRVVYDASAKRNGGPSLNDCLYSGPALSETIADVLARFRCHKTALVGDLEKAFLMISVAEDDRDALRFLWFDDPFSEKPKIIVLRFARVAFGLSSSPFLLNATLKHHIMKYGSEDPEFVQKLLQSLYVDDIISGDSDDIGAYELYIKAKSRLAEGGFNARKFVSNSKKLMSQIEENERLLENNDHGDQSLAPKKNSETVMEEDESYAKSATHSGSALPTTEKVLGVHWNKEEDQMVLDLKEVLEDSSLDDLNLTKRDVARVTSKIYDPMGFITPVTVKMKLFCQSLYKKKMGWDEVLDEKSRETWRHLLKSLKEAEPLRVPRCYFFGVAGKVQSTSLQGFCDASVNAYAAVVYLKIETADKTYLKFVTSKTRVAPLVEQTIPRLELLSALILARLISHVRTVLEELIPISHVKCWSDSEVALCWIRGEDREWKQFVQNRVCEIRRLVPPTAWSHCSSKDNPADIASRGASPAVLAKSTWISGPDWLESYKEAEQTSEEAINAEQALVQSLQEAKKEHCELGSKLPCSSLLTGSSSPTVSAIIECKRFSRLERLLSITALVLRFIRKLKSKEREPGLVPTDISANDIFKAEELWIRDIQMKVTANAKFKDWKGEFGVFSDPSGILRCGGRLGNAELSESQKHPVLLDASHHVTSLVIRACHERVHHNGVKETLTELRSRFWIVRGRQVVKKILHGCTICRRLQGKPYSSPTAPALPPFRITKEQPFTFTGVDFAGLLYVKENGEMRKTYVSVYTCAVSRAVHLDTVPDLTAEAFIRNFRRFAARRGLPRELNSDNGKTFKSASKTLKALFNSAVVRRHLANKGVKWTFNLERAPWWGGYFERLVQSVKRCLKKILKNAKITSEELQTVLVEIEATLNSRPLTFISSGEIEEPLTPYHLLCGRRLLAVPDQEEIEITQLNGVEARGRVALLERLKDHFWTRWKNEYLLELRNSHRIKMKESEGRTVAVGDTVIVHEDGLHRGLWRLGRVESLIKGKDGLARGAVVKTTTPKKRRPTLLRRPLQKLYPLELETCSQDDMTVVVSDLPTETENAEARPSCRQEVPCRADVSDLPAGTKNVEARPRREAARRADRERRTLTENKLL